METFGYDRITPGAVARLVKLCWTSRLLLRLCNSSLISSEIDEVVMREEHNAAARKTRKQSLKASIIQILTAPSEQIGLGIVGAVVSRRNQIKTL